MVVDVAAVVAVTVVVDVAAVVVEVAADAVVVMATGIKAPTGSMPRINFE